MKNTDITVALKRINHVLYGDSHIKVPENKLRAALEIDWTITGRAPNNDEIDMLVFVEDVPDPRVESAFPETLRVIGEEF